MAIIRRCRDDERDAIYTIVKAERVWLNHSDLLTLLFAATSLGVHEKHRDHVQGIQPEPSVRATEEAVVGYQRAATRIGQDLAQPSSGHGRVTPS